jgi:DNA-binding sugar fermentation-stimulating protein
LIAIIVIVESVAVQKDPKYGQLLQAAAAAGVQLIAVVCKLDEATGCIRHGGTLPIDLRYKLPV